MNRFSGSETVSNKTWNGCMYSPLINANNLTIEYNVFNTYYSAWLADWLAGWLPAWLKGMSNSDRNYRLVNRRQLWNSLHSIMSVWPFAILLTRKIFSIHFTRSLFLEFREKSMNIREEKREGDRERKFPLVELKWYQFHSDEVLFELFNLFYLFLFAFLKRKRRQTFFYPLVYIRIYHDHGIISSFNQEE